MRTQKEFVALLLWVLALFWPKSIEASDLLKENGAVEKSGADSLFESGRFEANANSGALFSPFIAIRGRPIINYTLSEIGVGYMLSEPREPAWWRGNFELAGDGFGSAILHGSGEYIAGATLWLRYNFI